MSSSPSDESGPDLPTTEPLRSAVRHLLESDEGLPTDLPTRHALVEDIRRLAREVEHRLGGSGEAGLGSRPGPGGGLHARRTVDLLRRELLRRWPHDDAGDGRALMEVLGALEEVGRAMGPSEGNSFGGDLLDPYAYRLLRELAHTLRSPITSMTFLTDAMREGHSGPVTETQERQLSMLYRAALSLGTLVEDILAHALVEESEAREGESPTPVSRVLEDVARTVRPICEEYEIELRVQVPDVPLSVEHPHLVRRILVDLALNGTGSARGGSLSLEAEKGESAVLRLTVRASGDPREPLDRRVFREEPGDEFTISKDGLRFATASHLLRQLSTRPKVTEKPGEGFEISFDLELPSESQAT